MTPRFMVLVVLSCFLSFAAALMALQRQFTHELSLVALGAITGWSAVVCLLGSEISGVIGLQRIPPQAIFQSASGSLYWQSLWSLQHCSFSMSDISRTQNHPASSNAGATLQLAIECQRPVVPRPGRYVSA
jgi:hypothetical protein